MRAGSISWIVFFLVFCFTLAVGSVYAGGTGDNGFVPLFEGARENLRLEVSGVYPEASEGASFNRVALKDRDLPHSFNIDVSGSDVPVRSYLYLLISDFYQTSMIFTVTFNGEVLVASEHATPVGPSPRGDGRLDHERQTFSFDVTGLVTSGVNTVTITDVYSTQSYFFDGALLLNFYPSEEEHMYWVYQGVEYLEKTDYVDVGYDLVFKGDAEMSAAGATLLTVYQNKEQLHDALFFNGGELKDKHATYLYSASDFVVKQFSVKDSLKAVNTVRFTMDEYQPSTGAAFIQYSDTPIYPSIVVLDLTLAPKPRVVVLASSVDKMLSTELFDYLELKGLDVIHATAATFNTYKDERFIIILGGPDALEGVGEIVKGAGILGIDDADYLRTEGSSKKYLATNPWDLNPDQKVWIFAGSDRHLTLQANRDNMVAVAHEIVANIPDVDEGEEEAADLGPCPESAQYPFAHAFADMIRDVYICDVVYDSDVSKWMVKLYNQGDDDINLLTYHLVDYRDTHYRVKSSDSGASISEEGYWTIYGSAFNLKGRRSTGVYLPADKGSITLTDSKENVLDKVVWDLRS